MGYTNEAQRTTEIRRTKMPLSFRDNFDQSPNGACFEGRSLAQAHTRCSDRKRTRKRRVDGSEMMSTGSGSIVMPVGIAVLLIVPLISLAQQRGRGLRRRRVWKRGLDRSRSTFERSEGRDSSSRSIYVTGLVAPMLPFPRTPFGRLSIGAAWEGYYGERCCCPSRRSCRI